jgi:transaldolase/glucose-6-phosphate isomerase
LAKAQGRCLCIAEGPFASLKPGDYAGFLAYIERNETDSLLIESIRIALRDTKKVATVAGFGPRFLHSTGQAYKGGPNSGAFLVITRDPDPDLAIPDHRASFGWVQIAQAKGDAEVLAQRGRRVLRVHLKQGGGGLAALKTAILAAL